MSSDGEINVAVKAEGVDEAAAEMGDAGGGGGGGGGGGDGDGGLGTAIRGGIVGGILSQALGPLLNILDPMLKILQAALAPVAVMLMRLLTPVLRFLLPLLPAWMDFVSNLPGMIDNVIGWIVALPGRIWDFVSSLPGMIWDTIVAGASWLGDGIASIAGSIASAIWDTIKQGFDSVVNWLQNVVEAIEPDFMVEGENREFSLDLETGFIDPRKVPGLKQAFEAGQNFGQTNRELDSDALIEVSTDETDWVVIQERNNSLETGG